MKIIDTHCHVQMAQYDSDRDTVIARALENGVGMVCVGIDLATSRAAVALAHEYEGLYASVGLHPNDNLKEEHDTTSYSLLATNPAVVAIGEVGLDYYRNPDKKDEQIARLKEFVELAIKNNKPLIIHCRDPLRRSEGEASAHDDMLSILQATSHKLSGVIHSFTGTLSQAMAYIGKGFHIGFNGIITFSRQYDDIVRGVPLECILLETDAPYLAPEPYRGKRNEPAYIIEVAKKLAELKNLPLETVLSGTRDNAYRLFSIVYK